MTDSVHVGENIIIKKMSNTEEFFHRFRNIEGWKARKQNTIKLFHYLYKTNNMLNHRVNHLLVVHHDLLL